MSPAAAKTQNRCLAGRPGPLEHNATPFQPVLTQPLRILPFPMAAGAPPAPSAACAVAAQPPAPVVWPGAGRASTRPAGTAGGRWVMVQPLGTAGAGGRQQDKAGGSMCSDKQMGLGTCCSCQGGWRPKESARLCLSSVVTSSSYSASHGWQHHTIPSPSACALSLSVTFACVVLPTGPQTCPTLRPP